MHRDVSGYIPMHIVFNFSSSASPKIISIFIKDRSNNYFLQISIGFCHFSNHIIKNNLAFISAGVPGPHIFDHENKLGPRSRHDRSVARVQRVCDIVHLGDGSCIGNYWDQPEVVIYVLIDWDPLTLWLN